MLPNLAGFKGWLNEGQDYDSWLKSNLGVDLDDFADIGNIVIANTEFLRKGGKPVPYAHNAMFKLYKKSDGTYALKDLNEPDPNDKEKAAFPHAIAPSKYAGKVYYISKDEFEKFVKPRMSPEMAAGASGGGMGGLGGMI